MTVQKLHAHWNRLHGSCGKLDGTIACSADVIMAEENRLFQT
jgi:hypothetical protein